MIEHKDLKPKRRPDGEKRVFLFLQGHPSGFWARLADGLEADGHRIVRVNLCLGDWVFWGHRPARNYRGRFSKWDGWLKKLCREEAITDIFYYADRLPYHRVARLVGKEMGIDCWAIEHGYLRPDWITVEPEAMGALSTFPQTREGILALAEGQSDPDMAIRFKYGFPVEAFNEVTYHLLQAFGRPFYPFYFSDKIYWPAIDYLSWVGELFVEKKRSQDARALQAAVQSGDLEFNLVGFQIQADYQIRASSHYSSLIAFIDEVMESFAANAPSNRHLIVKLHPLDNGLERWFSRIPKLASQHGLFDRVKVIKGGDLGEFIQHSKGVVLVNSTVSLHALSAGVPCFAAGRAVFNMPGLTHQRGMDTFWTKPDPVDTEFFAAFRRALTHIQVKGSFYNPEGRQAAIDAFCARFR